MPVNTIPISIPAKRKKKEAEERFKEINEAYEVLGNPEKRAKYDQLGPGWNEGMEFTPPEGSPFEFPGGFGRGFGRRSGGVEEFDLGDFSDFFQTLFGRAARPAGDGGRRADVEAVIELPLEEAIRGSTRRITFNRKDLSVTIPPGVREGSRIRLAGQGRGGGDLYLNVKIHPDPRYRVSGSEIETDVEIFPWEAALGAEKMVDTPDGPVRLKIPPESQAGKRFRLRGRGMPVAAGRGDFYALLKIVMPERLSAEQRRLFSQLAKSG